MSIPEPSYAACALSADSLTSRAGAQAGSRSLRGPTTAPSAASAAARRARPPHLPRLARRAPLGPNGSRGLPSCRRTPAETPAAACEWARDPCGGGCGGGGGGDGRCVLKMDHHCRESLPRSIGWAQNSGPSCARPGSEQCAPAFPQKARTGGTGCGREAAGRGDGNG